MEPTQSLNAPLLKLLIAALGAGAAWGSFRQYRARSRNPGLPRDEITDRWWRRLLLAAGIIAADVTGMIVLPTAIGVPHWLLFGLFAVLAAAVLLFFAAAAILGWRSAP
jgi:hypothetical protein